MQHPSLAFIGLGIMGGPMAGHLLEAGYPLTVYTRTRRRAQALLDRGAAWADSPLDAAQEADVVFTCLPDTPDVEGVLLGEAGVIHAGRTGQVVVDHSTISPSVTRRMAEALGGQGKVLLDAPISGGDIGAKNATLSIMVGGERAAFERVLPLLERMGKTITWCGRAGNGQLTKLVNQILVTVTNLAVCEALTFAEVNGLDLEATLQAVGGGAASSWQLANLGPRMIKGDYEPGFMVDLQRKDLRLVEEAMAERGISLQGVSLVTELFTRAQQRGAGRKGTQFLYEVVKQSAAARAD